MIDKILKEAENITLSEEKKLLAKMKHDFSKAYTSSYKELSKVMDAMPDGKLSKNEMMKYNRLEKLIKNIQDEIASVERLQDFQMKTYLKNAYEINYFYTGYSVDKTLGIKIGFSAVDRKQVQAMIDNPLLKIAITDNKIAVRQEIARTLTQSVVKGEGIRDTAAKLKDRIDTSLYKAQRIVQTETTKVMSKARTDGMLRVAQTGIEVNKEWVATLDGTTRDSHQALDGKRVGVDEDFKPGLFAPGEGVDPGEVINCRCTTVIHLPNYSTDKKDEYGYEDYDDWKRQNIGG